MDVRTESSLPLMGNATAPTTGRSVASTSRVMLIRHAHTDAVGRWLTGRAPGVPLSATGIAQADRLGRRLAIRYRLSAIYTSPLERARRTADAIARHQACDLHGCDNLSDIDFGSWTGLTFEELDKDPAWHTFNRARGSAVVPGGERPADVQRRIIETIARIAAAHPGETVAIVSHADLVRSALLHYRGLPLDLYHRIEIDPASVSAVLWSPTQAHILYVNDTSFAAAP